MRACVECSLLCVGSKYSDSSKLSAVWPSVIFSAQRKKKGRIKDSSTQTPTHAPTAHTGAANFPPQDHTMPPGDAGPPQFAFMSNMCSELLRGQNTLIGALCQKMDLDGSMSQLLSYHRELDNYYRDMHHAHTTVNMQHAHTTVKKRYDHLIKSKVSFLCVSVLQ